MVGSLASPSDSQRSGTARCARSGRGVLVVNRRTPWVMAQGVLDSRELGGYLLNHVVVDMDDSSLSLIRCGTLRPLADDFDEALSHPFTEQQTEDDSSEQPCGRQAQFNALNSPHIWVTRVSPGKPVSALSRVPAALTLAGVQWREG